VDADDTTLLHYFDIDNNSRGAFFAPPANNGLSFLGVRFNAGEAVGRVRIITSNTDLGPNDQNADLLDVVVMDDVLYSELRAVAAAAVPEPSTLALLLGGLLFFGWKTLRQQRGRRLFS